MMITILDIKLDDKLSPSQQGKIDGIVMAYFSRESLDEQSPFYNNVIDPSNEVICIKMDELNIAPNKDIHSLQKEAQQVFTIIVDFFEKCNFDIQTYLSTENAENLAMRIQNKDTILHNKTKSKPRKF